MRVFVLTAIRFVAVTILYFVCFAVVSGALLANASEQSSPAEAGATLAALFLVSLINAAVWSYVILRSRWTGWKLILAVFLVFYSVMPAEVRMVHLVETATSNFLFGWFVVLILRGAAPAYRLNHSQ